MGNNKWLVLGLVLSLIGNAALVGFIVGRSGAPGFRGPHLDPSMALGRVLRTFPDERQDALRPLLRQHFRALRPAAAGLRDAQRELADTLVTDPLDADAVRAALSRLHGRLSASQAASHDSFVNLVTALSADERRLLVESLRRRGRGPPGKP